MSVGLMENPVAKAKQRDTSIRLSMRAADLIKKVATLKGLTIAEFVDATVVPLVQREFVNEAKKITKGDKPE